MNAVKLSKPKFKILTRSGKKEYPWSSNPELGHPQTLRA